MTEYPPTVVPSPTPPAVERPSLQGDKRESGWFRWLCGGAAWSSMLMLMLLLASVAYLGLGRLSWDFISNFDSQIDPSKSGVLAGLWGSFWLMALTVLFTVPVGVGAAIYLEEYASDDWFTRMIQVNLSNLAGVPSIVYGILGLTAFVRMFGLFDRGGTIAEMLGGQVQAVRVLGVSIPLPFGSAVLSGALTLSLLVLPVVIVAGQEALRAVPASIRQASLALGATKWQTIRHQILPAALPGILTGVILAVSRAVGETAPLVMVGAAVFFRHSPGGINSPMDAVRDPSSVLQAPFDDYTALPMIIYNWVKFRDYQEAAAAGIIVLLSCLLLMNGAAIIIRNKYQRGTSR
ncbi:MAG: phosphate ABC transporter permease PstA [Planctomycetaceae bacterium]